MPATLAAAYAHEIAAALVRAGIAPPDTEVEAVAHIERAGVVVKVIIAKDEHQDTPPAQFSPDSPEYRIVNAAPFDRPVTMGKLAKLADYKCTDWFRDHVDKLCEAQILIRTKKGIRRLK